MHRVRSYDPAPSRRYNHLIIVLTVKVNDQMSSVLIILRNCDKE